MIRLKQLIRECIKETNTQNVRREKRILLKKGESILQESYKISEKEFGIPIPTMGQRIEERKILIREMKF